MNAPEIVAPELQARRDLEDALLELDGLAEVMMNLDTASEQTVYYLAKRLREHRDDAHDAFSRIYKLDEHREHEAGGSAS
jgi:hypothetical protein